MKHFVISLLFFASLNVGAQNLHWLSAGGGTSNDYAKSVAVSPNGNVLVTGTFAGTVDFDPGPGVSNATEQGQYDAFVVCYSPSGSLVWYRTFGGASGAESGNSIAVDAAGSVYVAGTFASTGVDIDPSPAVNNLNLAGSVDGFIIKYTASGNLVWSGTIGGTQYDEAVSVAVRGDKLAIAGHFNGTADLHPGSQLLNFTSAGASDIYIIRLDTAGNYTGATTVAGTSSDAANSVCIDHNDELVVTGYFNQSPDFDPSPSTFTLSSQGQSEVFIAKYTFAGALVWAKAIGSTGADIGKSVCVDPLNNLYMAGSFSGTADMDPGAGSSLAYNAGSTDFIVVSLDASGNYRWGIYGGGTNFDEAYAITTDGAGFVYITGFFRNTVDFNPTGVTYNLTSAGNMDLFVTKMTTGGSWMWSHRIGGPTAEEGYGITAQSDQSYFLCGRFTGTVDMDPTATTTNFSTVGLSDFFTAKYSPCVLFTSQMNASSCSSYTSPSGNHVWTTSGVYQDTMTSVSGCDSIIQVTLTINWETNATINASTCNIYLSPSGNYVWSTAGTYFDTIPNTAGCDSVITILLTINTLDNSVTNNSPSLSANQNGASYQWIDCNNGNSIIPGETNQNFNATVNGSYAVIITMGNCSDTSACEAVMNTGFDPTGSVCKLQVYPNPASTEVTINIAAGENIVITDLTGRTVAVHRVEANGTLNIASLPVGSYLISDTTNNRTVRFVKQ